MIKRPIFSPRINAGQQGPTGATGATGDNAYVYIAYASDASGTDFTTTFDANLDYIAIKSTATEIVSPAVGDFTGLWKNYKGATGSQGIQGIQGVQGDDGQGVPYAADTGAADAYAIDVTSNPLAYAAGDIYSFKAANANTGASTLNVDSLGVKTIKKNVSEDLASGDILAGQIITVIYDGTNFQVVSGSSVDIAADIHAATEKTTPADADELGLIDSAASYVLKKLTWANLKATLLTWLRLSTTIIPTNAPQGFLINGKISVTDTGSGLTVAIKTLAGTDPSATDPVYCRIGDTIRTISAALSVTKADGTNWCNAGSSELATKEIDYFVYLGYNATDGVVIGFSRYPGANSYDDFSTTTTNEKYCAISTITNAAATDYYEVIGRFAATLSAGAGYTWSVPAYTAKNLIQRPIYETRHLIGGSVAGFVVGNASVNTKYKVVGDTCFFRYYISFGSTSSYSTAFNWVLPFTMADFVGSAGPTGSAYIFDNGTRHYVANCRSNANNSIFIFADDAGAQQIANTYPFTFTAGDGVGLDISFRI